MVRPIIGVGAQVCRGSKSTTPRTHNQGWNDGEPGLPGFPLAQVLILWLELEAGLVFFEKLAQRVGRVE